MDEVSITPEAAEAVYREMEEELELEDEPTNPDGTPLGSENWTQDEWK